MALVQNVETRPVRVLQGWPPAADETADIGQDDMTIDLTPAAAAREAERQRRRYAYACAAADHAAEAGARFRVRLMRAKARRYHHEAQRLERMAQLRAFASLAWEA